MNQGFDYFRKKLPIDKHRLDDELVEQGAVLEMIGVHVAASRRLSAEAEDELDWVRARLIQYHKRSGVKMTAAEVECLVVEDPDRIQAFKLAVEAKQHMQKWEAMYDAWKSRGFALRELAALMVAGYYASNSVREDRGYSSDVRSNERRTRSSR